MSPRSSTTGRSPCDRRATPQHRDDRAQRLTRASPRGRAPTAPRAPRPGCRAGAARAPGCGAAGGAGRRAPGPMRRETARASVTGWSSRWAVREGTSTGADASGRAARHPHEGMPGAGAAVPRRPGGLRSPGIPTNSSRRTAQRLEQLALLVARRARRPRSGTSAAAGGRARWRCPGTRASRRARRVRCWRAPTRRASRRWGIDASIATSAGESHPASAYGRRNCPMRWPSWRRVQRDEPEEREEDRHLDEEVDDEQPLRHRRPRRGSTARGRARPARSPRRGRRAAAPRCGSWRRRRCRCR